MIEKLTPSQLQECYNRVSENGIHGLKGIEYFQAKQLLEYCKHKEQKNIELAYNAFTSNPEYPYPEKYKGGKELEHWSTVIAGYNIPAYVIEVVEGFLASFNNPAPPEQTKKKDKPPKSPKRFEDLFCEPHHAETCLNILRDIEPPVIDSVNNYIGKGKKGIFPLWLKVLKQHKPHPLIKYFPDLIYKDMLNNKINGLSLSKDASEFRKRYTRLEKGNVELEFKAILSQYSQDGKLGK